MYKETDVSHFFTRKREPQYFNVININGVLINCHFFSEDEIEFDIEPKEVNSGTEGSSLLPW